MRNPGYDSDVDAIADAIMYHAAEIATLSPRPMTQYNLDANVRYLIANIAVAAIRGEECPVCGGELTR